jgi:hypothetical protein
VDVEGDCYFDFASTVMGFPTRERTNLMANLAIKANPDTTLHLDTYSPRRAHVPRSRRCLANCRSTRTGRSAAT